MNLSQAPLTGLKPPPYTVYGETVSIIVPALKEEDYLGTLLTSIKNQTYAPIEIVIADSSEGDSRLKTLDITQSFGAKVVDAPFGNVSQARNVGAQQSSGSILIFMDADCILASDFVERLVSGITAGYKLAHGVDCYYDSEIQNIPRTIFATVKPLTHTTGRGVAMRREDFFSIGGYDENINPADTGAREDLDLGQRVAAKYGLQSIFLDKGAVVAEYARRPMQLLSRVWPERGWRKGKPIN